MDAVSLLLDLKQPEVSWFSHNEDCEDSDDIMMMMAIIYKARVYVCMLDDDGNDEDDGNDNDDGNDEDGDDGDTNDEESLAEHYLFPWESSFFPVCQYLDSVAAHRDDGDDDDGDGNGDLHSNDGGDGDCSEMAL